MPDEKLERDVRDIDRDLDTLNKVTFMDPLLGKQVEIRNTLDVRTSIVIGFHDCRWNSAYI